MRRVGSVLPSQSPARSLALALVCMVGALGLAPTAARATAMFMGLGVLPGATDSMATGIAADSSTVVGNSGGRAFLWTPQAGMEAIGIGSANAISKDSSTVVGGCGNQACYWTASGGAVPLGTLPGQGSSIAYGVSGDGSTIVGVSGNQAFRWTADTGMVGLGFLPGASRSIAHGVSADGSLVAGDSFGRSFRWNADGGMVGLGPLPGTDPEFGGTNAYAISADGSTIVGSGYQGDETALLWQNGGTAVALGRSPFVYTIAYAVSADGSTVVGCGSYTAEDCSDAFIWDADHGGRDLRKVLLEAGVDSVSDWETGRATGISADGRTIVGWGDPNFFSENPSQIYAEAWIAVLPEPGTDGLLLTGILGLAVVGRRRRA